MGLGVVTDWFQESLFCLLKIGIKCYFGVEVTMSKHNDVHMLVYGVEPEFLLDYINTPEMQKQAGISVSCGTIYSKMYNQMWYSSLDHSVAVALIIWNFTHDKKQTLSGLFHDIATE